MSKKKQSSVEYAIKKLEPFIPSGNQIAIWAILEEARAIHKEEVEEAYLAGLESDEQERNETEYYNQTFESDGNIKMKFKDAPVGARFKYPNSDKVWVKIHSYPKSAYYTDNGLIVQWNGNVEGYQSHCSFVDESKGIDFDTIVELI